MQCKLKVRADQLSGARWNSVIASLAMVIAMMLGMKTSAQTIESKPAAPKKTISNDLSRKEKRVVIQNLCRSVKENYVFPDIADKIVNHIVKQEKAGAYSEVSDGDRFAKMLTDDLRRINNDRHLQVYPTPEKKVDDETNLGTDFSRASGRHSNYGFEEVKVLAGNVGYIKLSSFTLDQLYNDAQGTAAAAMSFVSNSDALIFDLRDNGGGSPRLGRFLASYLYSSKPVHLNDYYFRTSDTTQEYWTLATVPGKRMPEVRVFILINQATFSAAEGFAYNLKHLDRATIVGKTSGGGAHGGATRSVTDRFQAYIPFSRSIHPITKTDFESVGVIPDVKVKSKDALLTAHILAIEFLAKGKLNEQNGDLYAKTLESLKAEQTPVVIDESELRKYVGNYEITPEQSLVVTMQNGKLFAQMTGDEQKFSVTAITKTRFRADGYKVEFTFEKNSDDKVVGLTIHKGNGLKARRTQ